MNPPFVELKSLKEKIKEHAQVDQLGLNVNSMSSRFASSRKEEIV